MRLADALAPNPASAWDRLVDAADPARMRVRIGARFGLRPDGPDVEEIWTRALLAVWNDRHELIWEGLDSFRDALFRAADREGRERAAPPDPAEDERASGASSIHAGPAPRTQPARAQVDQDEARALRKALDRLPPESRYLVWQAEFEGLEAEEIARRMELDLPLVRRELRAALIAFRHKLRAARRELAHEASDDFPG